MFCSSIDILPNRTLPPKLYKYRPFDLDTLHILSDAESYYAKSKSFNDPLDCDGTLKGDTDVASMEKLYSEMIPVREAENRNEKVKKAIAALRYSAIYSEDNNDNDAKLEKRYAQLLRKEIEKLFDAEMNSWGVLCLSEDWNCSLMWSHYADKHRGLCIEYDTKTNNCPGIKPVDYRVWRGINIAELMQWKLEKSSEAEKKVLEKYFFTKSESWFYEKEWRYIEKSNGVKDAPFRISGVYFGLNCDVAVRKLVVMLFATATWPVAFYDLYALEDGSLDRAEIDPDEVKICSVKGPSFLEFKDITVDETEDD